MLHGPAAARAVEGPLLRRPYADDALPRQCSNFATHLSNGLPVRRCLLSSLTTARNSLSDSPRFILLTHSAATTVLPGTRSSNTTPHGPPSSSCRHPANPGTTVCRERHRPSGFGSTTCLRKDGAHVRAGRASVFSSMSFTPIPEEFAVRLGEVWGYLLHDLAGELEYPEFGAEAVAAGICAFY